MSTQNLEILLVEDDPRDAELTLRALRKHNIANEVRVLPDGAQALDFLFGRGPFAAAERVRPRLILLDLKLPKVDGLEVLRAIKADAHLRTVPVVMLTSSREERDLLESYRLGVNSYIVKPVDFEQFMESVRQVGLYWLLLNQAPDEGREG
ncbi:MAG: response regulator [Candidatus Delongbacteria bacterium]